MFKLDRTLIIIDVETTGVDYANSSIIDLGAVLFSPEGKIIDKFQRYVIPYTEEWTAEAESFHNLSKKFLLKKGKLLTEVLNDFEIWVKNSEFYYDIQKRKGFDKDIYNDCQIAHWGNEFDSQMLKSAYKHCSKGYWVFRKDESILNKLDLPKIVYEQDDKVYPFYRPVLDIRSIVSWELAKKGIVLNSAKGSGELNSAKALGIKVNDKKCHGALYDAELSAKMLQQLMVL